MARRTYSPTEKAEAVLRLLAGESLPAVAEDLGIGESSLRRWLKRSGRTAVEGGAEPPAEHVKPSGLPLGPRPEWYGAFLTELASSCNVSHAIRAAGVSRATAYDARTDDAAFADMWAKARAIGAEVLEDEAIRRAHEGWDEPITYKGEITDTVRKFSDTLLIFLLKGAMPDKYRERADHNVNLGGQITFGYDDASSNG